MLEVRSLVSNLQHGVECRCLEVLELVIEVNNAKEILPGRK
jgi:hypothetical protein